MIIQVTKIITYEVAFDEEYDAELAKDEAVTMCTDDDIVDVEFIIRRF